VAESKDHDKKAFGGKQAEPFGKGKKEQANAKASKGSKGRERQTTKEKK
jgi:hypothetical protein